MSSFFSPRTQLPDIYGDDDVKMVDEGDWNFDGLDNDDEEIHVARSVAPTPESRPLPIDRPRSTKISSHSKNGRQADQERPGALSGSAATEAHFRPPTNTGSAKAPTHRRTELPANLKRPGSLLGSTPENDTAKRRKLENSQFSRRSSGGSSFARGTTTPAPHQLSTKATNVPAATKPIRSMFFEDSDSSEDEKPAMPVPSGDPPPINSFLAPGRMSEIDQQASLAKSKELREKALRDKLAQQARASARPSPAHTSASETFKTHTPQKPSPSITGRPSDARSRHVTPPPGHRHAKDDQSSRTMARRLQDIRRRHKLPGPHSKPGEVNSLDSDDENTPMGPPQPSLPRQPLATKPREPARERPKAPLLPRKRVNGSPTFAERLLEVKQEHPTPPPAVPRRPPIQPSIEIPDDVPISIERDNGRHERLSAAVAQAAAEKLNQERQRGADHAKAAAEQQRKKKEADEQARRQEGKRMRAQKLEEAEARQAEHQRRREQIAAKQRQDEADKQQNKAIEDQMKVLREEAKRKKAEAQAEAAKKKAEDDAEEEADRRERAELAKRVPVLDEQAQRDRDERIRIKKERAARNKQAQQADDENAELVLENALDAVPKPKSLAAMARGSRIVEDPAALGYSDDDDDPPAATYTPTPNLLSKPMSLNSAAGLRALAGGPKLLRPLPNVASPRGTSHERALGEILFEDAKLLQWRDTGDSWSAIMTKFEELTGKPRAEKTLQRRYSQISKALNEANVGQDLKRRVAANDEEARVEVNVAVHGKWPITPISAESQEPSQSIAPELQESDESIAEKVRQAGHALGEVCPEDMKLVYWRDEGKPWSEIVSLHQALTGKARAEGTLKRRARMVSKALQLAGVSSELKQALADGDANAKQQINSKIYDQPGSRKAAPLVTGTNSPTAVATTLTAGTVPPGLIKGSLGEILPIDALLVRWRRDGMLWAQVVENYRSVTGTRKSDHLLKPRHDEVEAALRDAHVYDDEIDALSVDAIGARANVNRKVYSTWPPVPNPSLTTINTPTARPRGRPPKVPRQPSSYEEQPSTPIPRAPPVSGPGQDTAAQHQYYLPTPGVAPQEPRPTTGGKTMNWEVFGMMMADGVEAQLDIPDTESDYFSEVDPDEPQDSYYHLYRVMRREYTVEDQEEGFEVDDVEWQECHDFEDIDEANEFAAKEILQQVPGRPDFQEGKYTMEHDDNDGFHYRKLTNEAVGQLEVFVQKVVRTPAERLPPKSKEGWLHDSLYYVKERITRTKETTDDVLGEKTKEISIREAVIKGTLTSHLDQANSRAITQFVKLTTPKSINLNANSVEMANRIECMIAELEAEIEATGEEIQFRGTDGKEASKKIEVWAEREKLSGPRNLFRFSK